MRRTAVLDPQPPECRPQGPAPALFLALAEVAGPWPALRERCERLALDPAWTLPSRGDSMRLVLALVDAAEQAAWERRDAASRPAR